MKKILAMILALVMVLSLVACGSDTSADEGEADTEAGTDAGTEIPEDEAADPDQPADMDVPADMDTPVVEPDEGTDAPSDSEQPSGGADAPATGATIGQTLLEQFKTMDTSIGAQAIADQLITNPVIEFMGGAMPVEPGLLSGFGNTEITGFSEGVMFGPMMGSIAFVGYIFEVEEGTDVAAFMNTLKSNCDPRWNICVEADEINLHNIGNTVFFLMSRTSYDE